MTNNKKLSFKEFKLYFESAEKVTDRRLEMNRWNYSIALALLVACATIFNWGLLNPTFLYFSAILIIVLSFMAILLCNFWIQRIQSLKRLNAAKFEVLYEMAILVSFSHKESDKRESFQPFDKEWDIMENKKEALEKIQGTNIFALRSSNMEYLIPKSFRLLFWLIIVATIINIIMSLQ